MLITVSIYAQPRYVDLKVNLHQPQDFEVIKPKSTIHFQFSIINQGPDSLLKEDTLIYQASSSWPKVIYNPERSIALKKDLGIGDSLVFIDSIKVDLNKGIKETNLGLRLAHIRSGFTIASPKYLLPEYFEDKKDNFPTARLIVQQTNTSLSLQLSEEILVYPNPGQSGSKLRVKTSKPLPLTSALLTNIIGKQEHITLRSISNLVYVVDLTHIPTGTYILRLNSENASATKKIVIW